MKTHDKSVAPPDVRPTSNLPALATPSNTCHRVNFWTSEQFGLWMAEGRAQIAQTIEVLAQADNLRREIEARSPKSAAVRKALAGESLTLPVQAKRPSASPWSWFEGDGGFYVPFVFLLRCFRSQCNRCFTNRYWAGWLAGLADRSPLALAVFHQISISAADAAEADALRFDQFSRSCRPDGWRRTKRGGAKAGIWRPSLEIIKVKRITIVPALGGQFTDLTIKPGTTPRDVKRQLGLSDNYVLTLGQGTEPLDDNLNLYEQVADGTKLYSTTPVEVGNEVIG